jgi:hypothetical protein
MPGEEQVEEWLEECSLWCMSLPSRDELRRVLGWDLLEQARKLDCAVFVESVENFT